MQWMSPESLADGKYSTKSDVFSFAVVRPGKVFSDDGFFVISIVCNICFRPKSILKELMEKCWAQDSADRPDFEKICEILEKMC